MIDRLVDSFDFVVMIAAHGVPRRDRNRIGPRPATLRVRERTATCQRATGRQIDWARDFALKLDHARTFERGVGEQDRGEQTSRVRMQRPREQILGIGLFHNLSEIEHCNAMAEKTDGA